MVELLSPVRFKYVGRVDNVINSGGVKIAPEKVELKLAQSMKGTFIISSEPHETLGEQVILVVEGNEAPDKVSLARMMTFLEPYERPKKVYTVSQLPYTDTGKIKRKGIQALLGKSQTSLNQK